MPQQISLTLSEIVSAKKIKEMESSSSWKTSIFETESGIKFSDVSVIGKIKSKNTKDDITSISIVDDYGNEIWCRPAFNDEKISKIFAKGNDSGVMRSLVHIFNGQLQSYEKSDGTIGYSLSVKSAQIIPIEEENEYKKVWYMKILNNRSNVPMSLNSYEYKAIVEQEDSIMHKIDEENETFIIGVPEEKKPKVIKKKSKKIDDEDEDEVDEDEDEVDEDEDEVDEDEDEDEVDEDELKLIEVLSKESKFLSMDKIVSISGIEKKKVMDIIGKLHDNERIKNKINKDTNKQYYKLIK